MANNLKQEELVEKMRELTDDIFNEDHLRNVLVPFINQQVRAALIELEHDYRVFHKGIHVVSVKAIEKMIERCES